MNPHDPSLTNCLGQTLTIVAVVVVAVIVVVVVVVVIVVVVVVAVVDVVVVVVGVWLRRVRELKGLIGVSQCRVIAENRLDLTEIV